MMFVKFQQWLFMRNGLSPFPPGLPVNSTLSYNLQLHSDGEFWQTVDYNN